MKRLIILFATIIIVVGLFKEIDGEAPILYKNQNNTHIDTISRSVKLVISSKKINETNLIRVDQAANGLHVPNVGQQGSQPHNLLDINEQKGKNNILVPCSCAVFLTGQFQLGSNSQPNGNPALTHEHEEKFPCNSIGTKQCTNKCLDVMVKHLTNSPTIICGTIDRDCNKERGDKCAVGHFDKNNQKREVCLNKNSFRRFADDTWVFEIQGIPPKCEAYLWIKNCNDSWVNTNLSAGREYCCKNGLPFKCPLKV